MERIHDPLAAKEIDTGTISYSSPSNIALVKYWGKKPVQIPANPSISFTLNNCKTTTDLSFKKSSDPGFKIWVDGNEAPGFRPKIERFFELIQDYLPVVSKYSFEINTSNSFPHSSGIASSASGMSALALCLCQLETRTDPSISRQNMLAKASFISRIGSGSACRSIYGGIVQWGKTDSFSNSSDQYGIPFYNYHKVFGDFQDTVLLVDKGQKKVSSSVGHGLMNNHPFAANRFEQAHQNLAKLKEILISGDLPEFIKIVESEALTLHAMMMTSHPYFMLFKPNTVEIIEKVWDFREQTGLHLCITLDAGANVHLLYPASEKEQVLDFVQNELVGYCENGQYICDHVGSGPTLLNEDYA